MVYQFSDCKSLINTTIKKCCPLVLLVVITSRVHLRQIIYLFIYLFSFYCCGIVQLVSLKSMDGADVEWCKEVKGNMYDMVVEGFQLLSRWTARIWEQCAWKFSRPCKDPISTEPLETLASYSDYEKVLFCIIFLFKGFTMMKNNVWSFFFFDLNFLL